MIYLRPEIRRYQVLLSKKCLPLVEWWEHSVAAEEAPAQDQVGEEPQQDCFGMSIAQ